MLEMIEMISVIKDTIEDVRGNLEKFEEYPSECSESWDKGYVAALEWVLTIARVGMDFIDDDDKMRDFMAMSKEDFLEFYSYLTEDEYEATCDKLWEKLGFDADRKAVE